MVDFENISYHNASADTVDLPAESQDFGYSLGVLHHVPDTDAAIASCVRLLKPGAPLLLYLYYKLENRPWWFRVIWGASDLIRKLVILLPPRLKHIVTDCIAALVYFPLARGSRIINYLGFNVYNIPLSYYKDNTFYTMRTDARDRFGTPLEKRFSKDEMRESMERSGLERIIFSDSAPFWCAVGFKAERN